MKIYLYASEWNFIEGGKFYLKKLIEYIMGTGLNRPVITAPAAVPGLCSHVNLFSTHPTTCIG